MEIQLSPNCTAYILPLGKYRRHCQYKDAKTGVTCGRTYRITNRKRDDEGKVSYPDLCGYHANKVKLEALAEKRRKPKRQTIKTPLKAHTCKKCGESYSLRHRRKTKSKYLDYCGKCAKQLNGKLQASLTHQRVLNKNFKQTIEQINSIVPGLLAPVNFEEGEIKDDVHL